MEKQSEETSQQTMVVTWAALLMSQVIFVVLIYFTKPEVFNFDLTKPVLGDNAAVIGAFAFASLSASVAGFVVKRKTLERSVAEQSIGLVQTAMIIGCATAEVSSLLGVMTAFMFSYQYFFAFIALGVVGILLHFPKRSDILAASFRR